MSNTYSHHVHSHLSCRWVRRYINKEVFTGHVRSTQRGESLNGTVAEKCGSKSSLMEVFTLLNEWCDELLLKEIKQRQQEEQGKFKEDHVARRPIMQSVLSHKLTRYVTLKVAEELLQSDSYQVERIRTEKRDNVTTSSFRVGLTYIIIWFIGEPDDTANGVFVL